MHNLIIGGPMEAAPWLRFETDADYYSPKSNACVVANGMLLLAGLHSV